MRVLGADFARWQGKIKWESTADSIITRKLPSGDTETVGKLRFVYCKSTHGTSGIDQEFAHNSVGRKAMKWSGYYFWFVPTQAPKAQAEWFVRNVEKTYDSSDLCAAMDFEELAPAGMGGQRLLDAGQECGERVEELLGHQIIIYSGRGYWRHVDGCQDLDSQWYANHAHWHAEYRGHVPTEDEKARLSKPWESRGIQEKIWQFDGDKGLYLPNGTDSDFNFFNGSEDDLQFWIDNSGITPPTRTLDQKPPEWQPQTDPRLILDEITDADPNTKIT